MDHSSISFSRPFLQQEHDAHLKNTDREIFDDDDFYQQLLRQLIEQKSAISSDINSSDSVEMTRYFSQSFLCFTFSATKCAAQPSLALGSIVSLYRRCDHFEVTPVGGSSTAAVPFPYSA